MILMLNDIFIWLSFTSMWEFKPNLNKTAIQVSVYCMIPPIKLLLHNHQSNAASLQNTSNESMCAAKSSNQSENLCETCIASFVGIDKFTRLMVRNSFWQTYSKRTIHQIQANIYIGSRGGSHFNLLQAEKRILAGVQHLMDEHERISQK